MFIMAGPGSGFRETVLRRLPSPVYLVLANLFWSGNFIAGRFVAGSIPPLLLNALRWTEAFILLVPLLTVVEGLKMRATIAEGWRIIILLALTGVVGFNGLVYTGLTMTTATRGALINAIIPLATAILAFLMLGEPITFRQAMGIALSFGGVSVAVTNGNLSSVLRSGLNLGDLLMLGSSVVWGLYTIWGRQAMKRMSPLRATTFAVMFGLPISWLVALLPVGKPTIHLSAPVLLAVLYVGSMTSVVAFLFWYIGVKRMGVNRSSPYINLLPVFTVVLAILFLGETMAPAEILGGVAVLAGVVLGTTSSTVRPPSIGKESNVNR